MPLLEGNVVPPGLKKPESMSGIDGKQKLLYGGNYLAFDSKGTDVGEFTPPWSSLKASLLEGRSPLCHFSGMDRQNALVYRQDDHSSNEGHSNSSRMCHTPVKQGFSVYTKSPRLSSPRASTTLTVKKHKNGGENSTPGFENSVYLNIPKPVYGQNPCCHELGCGLGPRYGVEHGLQRIPSSLYEHEWMQNESRYSERAHIQRKDAVLQFEPTAEQIKKINTDTCSPGKVRKLPAVDPSYNSYPYIPTHTFLSPVSESSQQLHASLRGCQSHFSSHATYEGMTSEIYQDSSPLPKYGQLAHHPLVYYPPAHVEIENRHLYKDIDARRREDVPILIKNTLLNSRDQSRAPHPLHGEIPVHRPGSEGLPRHPFNQRINYPYPYYAVPRYHLPPSQMRSALTRPHMSPPSYPSYLNISPTGSQATVTLSAPANKPSPAQYVNQPQAFPHVDQTSVPHYAHQSAVSPPNIALQRFVPPFASLRLDKPVFPAGSLSSDYSSGESRIPSPKTPQSLSGLSPSWLLPSPTLSSEQGAGDAPSSNTTLLKRLLKRSFSTVSDKDGEQNEGMDLSQKRIKVEIEDDLKRSGVASPPMPVIDSVFSLAPYRSLMGLRSEQSPQREEPKPKLCIKKERADSPVQNQEAPSEKPVKEVSEPAAIQVKKEPPEDESVEGNSTIKNEMKESEVQRVEVVEKPEPEWRSRLSDEDMKPSESNPAVPGGNPPPLSDKCLQQQEVVVSPVTITTPKLPESKLNIGDVPPKPPCFQLFSDQSTFVGYPETTLQQIVESPGIPKPVRKNFLELHRSVCKQVSTFVSTCSVGKLRDWLSQMQITESPSSLSKIKISLLSGFRARKEWLDPAIGAALEKVLERLREYSSQDRFPFPHVMRAGSVFLPMLVVKEILFPMVQGSFIDQVLQEHKVELRPSTLSEEKFLIQCDKRASSSKLRRLMSLKHLPEVYTDVFNLVYYTQVCKHIGLADDTLGRDHAEEVSASPATLTKDTPVGHRRTKSRIKRSSRLLFLDDSWSDEDEKDSNVCCKENITKDVGVGSGAARSSLDETSHSWMCPLSLDDLSSSTSEPELELRSVRRVSAPAKFHHVPKKGMVLKLRRMGGPDERKAHYQAVSDSYTSQTFEKATRPRKELRRISTRHHREQRAADIHKTFSSSSKRRLLKIKYCPFLSACHSVDRRRRWVLRSAVKTARRAMRFYPDLVGKRIRHLYEEHDKTEVWYRGEVVRVHEAHVNPLKTVYEVRYDSEPEWTYYLELLVDYRKGWIQIEE